MKIVISSGHGKYVRGASGYIDEVDEARLVVEDVALKLRTAGVTVITYHDNTSKSQSENLNRIVNYHNSQTRDWDVSVHFNAYQTTSKPMGSEVLYVTQNEMADDVVDAICAASGLINRGPKYRSDLAFLNGTKKPAILIETCFVDSKADVDIYHRKYQDICAAIAGALSGAEIEGPPPDVTPPIDRPPAEDRPTIGKGDTGAAVKQLQASMGVLKVDGDFGSITDTQVRAFQAAAGVTADGIVGPITWEQVDALDARVALGEPLGDATIDAIVELAKASSLMNYSWPDRGKSPPGYLAGMALCFAACLLPEQPDIAEAIDVMSMANTGLDDLDALAWYDEDFAELGMRNNRGGVDTLRHLFVLMIGLAMRESSGRYCEGRDLSASNVQAETAEAGLMQTSWNIATADDSIGPLLDEYWDSPCGFRDVFKEGISATANNLSCYGKGDGARYQWLSRFAPLFHVLVTGVGLRARRQHWGPINRKEAALKREADELLKGVQRIMDEAGEGA